FATTSGTVRRNKLSDFADVRRSGIIAMKLEEGEAIVDVQICSERDDVLLTTAGGRCIRFKVSDPRPDKKTGELKDHGVRVFDGRTSMGVRGIVLDDDKVISMSILRRVDITAEERVAYFQMRQAVTGEIGADADEEDANASGVLSLAPERYSELS